jgi:molybdopterin synthase sulfur carrier subunit
MRDTLTATLTLVYLARLREAFGRSTERIELPPTIETVGALREWLAARGGSWASELAPGRAVRIAVNHTVADAATPVRDGDEVALFPPVTGG